MFSLHRVLLVGALVSSLSSHACGGHDGYRDRVYGIDRPARDAGMAAPDGSVADAGPDAMDGPPCPPALASESLRPRASVMSQAGQGASGSGLFTRDLFNLFRSHCGACHVDQGLGGLKVSLQDFSATVTASVLERIRSNDPESFMPPLASGGKPFAERLEGDPVRELSTLLESWLDAGSPEDVFYPETGGGSTGSVFFLDRERAMAMTNLGHCIPTARMVGQEQKRSAELDAMFAAAEELPERLEQTDLFTLDAEVLARHGVVSFAPTYPLWSENSRKWRLVRVPRGSAIELDAEAQLFRIPPNTRFYKTFFKRVVDYRGNESFRKMETRVIVSRPDVQAPDGAFKPAALFGTYVWSEDESEAVLLRDPLRDGTPFRDRLITYITDEKAADAVIRQGPDNLQEELERHGLSRTYAVPGSNRCVHCHMGAPNASFVLGFTPLQLHRRAAGEGGVIEPAERDELTQLARFIDYGIVAGMTSAADVVPLERSQGSRKPRNRYELDAQGYLYGNCAHCHNPRGYPSVIAPELRDVLDFQPSETGGVFQFPLDRVSPRIFRGENRDIQIPYISPSVYDRPRQGEISHPDAKVTGQTPCNAVNPAECLKYIYAPWRSLIYRNVDTPFSYSEDSAIFPHMPMDTSGYDCRTRQILGTWMVSIPSRFIFRGVVPPDRATGLTEDSYYSPSSGGDVDTDHPQPFVEVLPDDPGYVQAEREVVLKLARFANSQRLRDCPDPDLDIVDPRVVRGEAIVPGPIFERPILDEAGKQVGVYSLNIPERAHFADTDLTQAPGDWNPRRPDWADLLVADGQQTLPDDPEEARAITMLQGLRITDAFRRLALDEVPFGLWKQKDGCSYPGQRRVEELSEAEKPRWLRSMRNLEGSEPIYALSAGAMVFDSICANCHGPQADSQGRLAATIADMTGGQTRVANLRDGLLGPPGSPGANVERVFGGAAGAGLSAEEWAGRYVVWMGLGGTERMIPASALAVVGSTSVLGVARQGSVYELQVVKDANMLTVARVLCAQVLPKYYLGFDAHAGLPDRRSGSALIASNGDAELWERLCTFDNPLPVRVVDVTNEAGTSFRVDGSAEGLCRRDRYPAAAPVGDPRAGTAMGLAADNPAPWCFNPSLLPEQLEGLRTYWKSLHGADHEPPLCPAGYADEANCWSSEDLDRWTMRGSMNAGLSVFLYLEALARGDKRRAVPHDRCEELRAP